MPKLRPPYLVRIVRSRPRLFASSLVGLAAMLVLPARLVTSRILGGWDIGIAVFLVLVYRMIARAEVDLIRRRAAVEDEGQVGILVLSVTAAMASLGAIVIELSSSSTPGSAQQRGQMLLAVVTILLSWAFTHIIFALHYAHEFYRDPSGQGSGLTFPGDTAPDYWDFLYFSLVIGMTSQVSDVAVTSKAIRRTVSAHGVLSFIFNTAVIALTVNIAASVI